MSEPAIQPEDMEPIDLDEVDDPGPEAPHDIAEHGEAGGQ